MCVVSFTTCHTVIQTQRFIWWLCDMSTTCNGYCACVSVGYMHVCMYFLQACMSFELSLGNCTGYNRLTYKFGVKELTCILHRVYAVCGHVMCMWQVWSLIDPALKVLYGMYCDSGTCMMWTPWGPSVLISRVAPMCMRVWDQFIQVHVQIFKPGVRWNSRSLYTFTTM
jgi:hypothetical protein